MSDRSLQFEPFEAYARHLEQNRRAPSTLYRNRQILTRFEHWAGANGLALSALTPIDLDRYVNGALRQGDAYGPPLASGTRHGHLTCVRSAFQWALDVDLCEGKNPCRRVSVPFRRPTQPFLSNGELRAVLSACVSADEFLVTCTLLFSGLRVGEFAALRRTQTWGVDRQGERIELSWVDLPKRRFHVLGKGEKPRDVPIHKVLVPLVEGALATSRSPFLLGNLSGGHLWTSGVLRILSGPMLRARVKQPGLGAHAYRRAFNDSLRRNARDRDFERRLILGHSLEGDINASRYASASLDELQETIAFAYCDDPILASQACL
jgi:integrase